MKHQWKGGMTPSTPDSPPEGYSYCDICGMEETDDNRDGECFDPNIIECAGCGVITTTERADFAEGDGGLVPDRWFCRDCQGRA